MLHLYTMPLFSTCIPGRHAPGRTISLKNYSYQVLLYSYRRSTPFLELLQQQRSCLLKLYTEAVIKSQLKHFAPSSSSPTVPWVYNSPLCEKEKKKKKSVRKQGWRCISPYDLRNGAFGQWGTLPNTQSFSSRSKPQGHIPGSRVCQGKITST